MLTIEEFLSVPSALLKAGQFTDAILATQALIVKGAEFFGKQSLETTQFPYLLASAGYQCYMAVKERGLKPPFPDKRTLLAYSSGHALLVLSMLDDLGHRSSVQYLNGSLLMGQIILQDETNFIPTAGDWENHSDMTREQMINFAKNVLLKGFQLACQMLETSHKGDCEIATVAEKLRCTLLLLLPRPKLKERHLFIENVGFLKMFVDDAAKKIYFDAQNLCYHLGITVEEAEKIVDAKDKIDLNAFEIVDEKS